MPGGRPALGPKLVWGLEGSRHAKMRMQAIFETLAERLSVAEACERLGISESTFHELRKKVLQAGLSCLEPKSMGRPPKLADEKDRRMAELEAEIEQLKAAVATSQVREELALAMPFLAERRKLRAELERIRGGKSRGRRRRGSRARAAGAEAGSGGEVSDGRPREPQGTRARGADEGGNGGQGHAGR